MPTARMKNNGSKTDKRRKSHGHTPLLEASPLVRRFAARIVDAAGNAPILDVASGMGRNAMIFAQLGCTVICLDKNQDLLRRLPNNPRILPMQMDLATDRWLFGRSHLGGIVNGGYLLIETVPAHGNNFLELPKEGELRSALERAFDFDFYQEKKAGPPEYKKVTVRLLARRRD
jgi:hypothetical protein